MGALITVLVMAAAPAVAQTLYAPTPVIAPGASVCPDGLCQPEALAGVFAALAETEAGTRDRPVHILQIGDSHTAGDRITGKLRVDLQQRFGRAGRGVMPPGVPYDGYAPYQVTVAQRGWLMETAPLQPPTPSGFQRKGLAGVSAVGLRDAVMGFELEPGSEATALGVCGRSSVDRSSVIVEAGGIGREIDLGDGIAEVCRTLTFPAPATSVRVTMAGESGVIDSVWLGGAARGVTVSNLGRVGATLRDLAVRDEDIVSAELAAWRPDLIVLAFGTNEGFDDGLDPAAYEALLRGQVARLRRLAPGASLMLLGAPDGLRNGVTGGCSADGVRAPPPKLAVVRDVQRRVAADLGVALWDWHGRMGGVCSADRLALGAEPLMRGDRVHFTSAGADWIGGILSGDLMGAYDRWKAAEQGAD
ncbi:GDSL-type esterase/lipase family protein [Brevundimonas sp. GCM10030266]|uniref:GDSL-type esterase/lipase family protein n=1 Tax=Brevundimonas sp. GCM10030266 TaxID=3273386 RepID=UPI003614AA96